ncbi:hypothetical protein KFL_001680010 [Klebsormidium nitens]|uniref:Uncharacterized protein n=1 Tax=Klebsormidium nitens TaxID=105231 RepID=A0A1Y1HZ33_KLENI|nr:hypothetical protein KFL_001680010 [Klebsormidium nitens]|eukprot:GAQ83905.1 hypothetical protein KFL_001680010 [Klebsormidium nitens]
MASALSVKSFEVARGPKSFIVSVGSGVKIKAARGEKAGAWKGATFYMSRVLEILVRRGKVQLTVEHLYKKIELTRDLELNELPKQAKANQLWPSPCQDTYDVETVLDVFTVFHYKTIAALYPGGLPAIMQLGWEHRAATASIIFVPHKAVLDGLLGKGWNEKVNGRGLERVKACIAFESLKIRYHYARQCILMTWHYQRFMWNRREEEWIALDLNPQTVLQRKEITLQVYLDGEEHLGEVRVEAKDNLSDVRVAIITQLVGIAPQKFNFFTEYKHEQFSKIQSRFEKRYSVKKFLLDEDDGEIIIDKQDPPPTNFDDLMNIL